MVEVKNIQGITKITFMEKIHNYCSSVEKKVVLN